MKKMDQIFKEHGWIDKGWKTFQYSVDDMDRLFKYISDNCQEQREAKHDHRRMLHFSVVKKAEKIWAWKKEEALERFIVYANENFANQLNVSDARTRESIDLVEIGTNKKICKLIELKPWDTVNSPLYGLVELLKNYYLLNNRKDVVELMLLAPKKYYQRYYDKSFAGEIFKAIDNLHLRLNLKFSLSYLDLEEEDFNDWIISLSEQAGGNWKEVSNKTDAFNLKKLFDLSKVKGNNIVELVSKLKFNNWAAIHNPSSWPQ